jgi:hypothetical protein
MFRYKNKSIVNERGQAIEVSGGVDGENQNVIVWKLHGGLNQQWTILYADEDEPDPKKGELNKKFGFYVERYFYIQSYLTTVRYLDVVNKKVVIKTPNGRNSQKWYFDQSSKTIKNVESNWSWDITNKGKGNSL